MKHPDKTAGPISASTVVIPDLIQVPKGVSTARLGLGRAGSGMPTNAMLSLMLDHARARDAVHLPLDWDGLEQNCSDLGLETLRVQSAAPDRKTYLLRPDLGRSLSAQSRALLVDRNAPPCDVLVIVGDGLSATAVEVGATPVLDALIRHFENMKLSLGPLVLASQARVGLADEIGQLLNARLTLILIGERPGLSAADSLGAYMTWGPNGNRTDADRNCVSNIRSGGLDPTAAALKLSWLVNQAFKKGASGVQLKDESDDAYKVGLGAD